MLRIGSFAWRVCVLGGLAAVAGAGCGAVPSAHTVSRNYSLGEAPVDLPGDGRHGHHDDCVAGGKLFKMYCGACHNARPLSERPFSNHEVATAHMREQAYLTGKEYRQLIHFLRRWHDVGPPTPDVEPSPKKLMFSQPIPELRSKADGGSAAQRPGFRSEVRRHLGGRQRCWALLMASRGADRSRICRLRSSHCRRSPPSGVQVVAAGVGIPCRLRGEGGRR
jgi:hypothetical protein